MPKAKTKKATLTQVKSKQSKRSTRARAADASGTANSTFGQRNRDGLGRWMKSPRRHDVAGVDTVGKGKAPPKKRKSAKRK